MNQETKSLDSTTPNLNDVMIQVKNSPDAKDQPLDVTFLPTKNSRFKDLFAIEERPSIVTRIDKKGIVVPISQSFQVSRIVVRGADVNSVPSLRIEFEPCGGNGQIKIDATSTSIPGTVEALVGYQISQFRIRSTGKLLNREQLVQKVIVFIRTEEDRLLLEANIAAQDDLKKAAVNEARSTMVEIDLEREKAKSEILKERTLLQFEAQAISTEKEGLEKQRITQAQDLKNLKAEISTKTKASEDLVLQSTEQEKHLNSTKAQLQEVTITLLKEKQDLTNIRTSVEQLESDKSALIQSITEAKGQVEKWSRRKNIFAANLEGILSANNWGLVINYVLLILILSPILAIAYQFYDGASGLLQAVLFKTPEAVTWGYLASRMPFAIVGSALAFGLTRYAFPSVYARINQLHDFRRNMHAQQFLITESTEKAAGETGLSPEQTASLLIEKRLPRLERYLAESMKAEVPQIHLPESQFDLTPAKEVAELAAKLLNKGQG